MTTTKTKTRVAEGSAVGTVSKLSIGVMGAASLLVGLWAIACLVGATITGGGPVALISGWLSAIGM